MSTFVTALDLPEVTQQQAEIKLIAVVDTTRAFSESSCVIIDRDKS